MLYGWCCVGRSDERSVEDGSDPADEDPGIAVASRGKNQYSSTYEWMNEQAPGIIVRICCVVIWCIVVRAWGVESCCTDDCQNMLRRNMMYSCQSMRCRKLLYCCKNVQSPESWIAYNCSNIKLNPTIFFSLTRHTVTSDDAGRKVRKQNDCSRNPGRKMRLRLRLSSRITSPGQRSL